MVPLRKTKKNEINRMLNGCIIETLTSVDIREIVKIREKIVQIYECVIYQENFKTSPLRKDKDKFFALRQKYKDEGNDLMQKLVKLIVNSFYRVQI